MISSIFNVVYPRQCLCYCLEDKLVIGQDGQKHPLYKDRAEILFYNQCFGEKEDLISQFNEVIELHQNVKEPIFHIALALPEQERFSKSRWIDVSRDCARTMGFAQNQFVTILHKDRPCQHIHIVANRVGFDRHLVRDNFTGYRLSGFCYDMEIRYELTRTLHPWQMSSDGNKQTLRKNIPLDRLKEALQQTLKATCDYPAFEAEMRKKEIKVYRNEKGIAFLLDQRIVFKGSEAGFSWKKIEVILRQNQELKQKQEQQLKDHIQRLKQSTLEPNQSEQQPKQQQASELEQLKLQPGRRLTPEHEETEKPRLRQRISHHL